MKKIISFVFSVLLLMASCANPDSEETANDTIQGWNILTSNDSIALKVIERSKDYNVNHLQLSHRIVMDLKDVKDPAVAAKVNMLTKLAHEKNIKEVTIWDHALYHLDYYPDKFKTGPNGTINLDNPQFWEWIKEDYREMLKLVPEIDGIVLTFIETGAHVEDQYSEVLKTEEEKLAAMVDTLASIMIDEYDLKLYVRTFMYTKAELRSMMKAINLISNKNVIVMTKEAPHDFFLTHPVSSFVENIEAPVLIEFDAAHEYNGQGIIASIFPEVHLKRWEYYSKLPNVIGYVIRTDRKNTTTVFGNPAEINLFALDKAVKMKDTSTDSIYDEYISKKYGVECIPYLKPAFKLAPEIILSTLYTLGLPLNTHSRLDIENDGAYQRHVSGKWLDNKSIKLTHGIDTTLHYWKDIVNHLAPKWYKTSTSNQLSVESQWVLDSNWLEPVEMMNETYLELIISEKLYGVEKAREALQLVKDASDCAKNKELYDTTLHVFERTLLTARLYKEVASAYFAYRVYYNSKQNENNHLLEIIDSSLNNIPGIITEILNYKYTGAEGQFIWKNEAYRAMRYYNEFKSLKDGYKTTYTPNTFERFHYHGVTEKEKKELYGDFMKNIK